MFFLGVRLETSILLPHFLRFLIWERKAASFLVRRSKYKTFFFVLHIDTVNSVNNTLIGG